MRRDEVLEVMALALRQYGSVYPGSEYAKMIDRQVAAVLTALEANGMVVVPVEPTEGMLRECQGEGLDHPVLKYTKPHERGGSIPLLPVAFYRAMINARPSIK